MGNRTKVLAAFCPREALHMFKSGVVRRLTEPLVMEPCECVVMWIDICKYTRLGERVSAKELGRAISNYFGILIEIISRHGGDVLKFCGDALLVSFRSREDILVEDLEEGEDAVRQAHEAEAMSACRCAIEIQEVVYRVSLSSIASGQPEVEMSPRVSINGRESVPAKHQQGPQYQSLASVPINVKVMVALGNIHAMFVGGAQDRWEYLILGEPFKQLRVGDKLCLPREIIVTDRVAEILKSISPSSKLVRVDSGVDSTDSSNEKSSTDSQADRTSCRDDINSTRKAKPEASHSSKSRFASTTNIAQPTSVANDPASVPASDLAPVPVLPSSLKLAAKGKLTRRTLVRKRASVPVSVAAPAPVQEFSNELQPQEQQLKRTSFMGSDSRSFMRDATSFLLRQPPRSNLSNRLLNKRLYKSSIDSCSSKPYADPHAASSTPKAAIDTKRPGRAFRRSRALTTSILPRWSCLDKTVMLTRRADDLTSASKKPTDCHFFRLIQLGHSSTKGLPAALAIADVADELVPILKGDEGYHPIESFVPTLLRERLNLIAAHDPLLPDQPGPSSEQVSERFWSEAANFDEARNMRNVTVLFVKIHSITEDSFDTNVTKEERGSKLVDAIHEALIIFETNLYRYGGMLRQMLCDDKGTVAIGVFGTPCVDEKSNQTNALGADDVAFALLCAVETQCSLAEHEYKFKASIGVATGEAYCGIVGSPHRAEYMIVGDTVNTAARIMGRGAFDSKRAIACCEVTKKLCDGSSIVSFHKESETMFAKNKSQPVQVHFCYLASEIQHGEQSEDLVGAVRAKSVIGGIVKQSQAIPRHINQVIVFHGDRGIGKSAICDYMRVVLNDTQARHHSMTCCSKEHPADVRNEPFAAIRSLFGQILGTNRSDRDWVLELVSLLRRRNANALRCIELLGDVFPEKRQALMLAAPEAGVQPFPFQSPTERRAALYCLLVALVQIHYTFKPVVITVDDVHLLDDSSWSWLILLIATCSMRRGLEHEHEPTPRIDKTTGTTDALTLLTYSSTPLTCITPNNAPPQTCHTPSSRKDKFHFPPSSRRRRSCTGVEAPTELFSAPPLVLPPTVSCAPADATAIDTVISKNNSGNLSSIVANEAVRPSTVNVDDRRDFFHDPQSLVQNQLDPAVPIIPIIPIQEKIQGRPSIDLTKMGQIPQPAKATTTTSTAKIAFTPEMQRYARNNARAWVFSDDEELNSFALFFCCLFGIFEAGPRSLVSVVMTGPKATSGRTEFQKRMAKLKQQHNFGRISLRLVPLEPLTRMQSDQLVLQRIRTTLPSSVPASAVQPPLEMLDMIFQWSAGSPALVCQIIQSAIAANVVTFAEGKLVCNHSLLEHAFDLLKHAPV